MMDYQSFVEEFRKETAQRMAEFEKSLAVATMDIMREQEKPQVAASKSVRRRGRARGILRR
ncbi:MAG: hypothetical protein Q4A82_07920 [Corynebacterium sp.]|nr:hypothetical protein [Corynebacterium sp.]